MDRYYLKSSRKATIKGLKTGNFAEADQIHEHNENTLKTLYKMLINGQIRLFYTRSKNYLTVWHKSTRDGVLVQESHMWIRNGELIPTYHADLNSFDELIKEQGYPLGQYYRVRRN